MVNVKILITNAGRKKVFRLQNLRIIQTVEIIKRAKLRVDAFVEYCFCTIVSRPKNNE
jgi:hypothetical protein